MKHTELPWSVNALASGHIVSEKRSIGSVGGFNDGTEKTHLENEANAAFIVKAVNNHESLKEALRLALLWTDEENDVYEWRKNAEEIIKQIEGEA